MLVPTLLLSTKAVIDEFVALVAKVDVQHVVLQSGRLSEAPVNLLTNIGQELGGVAVAPPTDAVMTAVAALAFVDRDLIPAVKPRIFVSLLPFATNADHPMRESKLRLGASLIHFLLDHFGGGVTEMLSVLGGDTVRGLGHRGHDIQTGWG